MATGAGAFAALATLLARRRARHWAGPASRRLARCAVATTEKAAPTDWKQLLKEAQATDAGRSLAQADKDREQGLACHTDAKVRYFGESREKPRITLYRDNAAWCPYCQKVWLLLEAKEIDYEISKVAMRSYGDKPEEFLRKVPRGLLPAVEIDGRLMTESLDIMFTIERMFADPARPMFPTGGAERDRAVKLLELERAVFGAWCSYLFRPEMPIFGGNSSDFEAALRQTDIELGLNPDTDWFLPYSHPTIVDMQYASHVERMVASALYYKGYDIRANFENIDRWLTAFEELPYYMATKSDFYTHCMDIPPQYGPPFPSDNTEALRARALVNPKEARLPINWSTDPEPWTRAQAKAPMSSHRIEAAWSLIRNHKAVARFCCRAAGSDVGAWARGNPYRAELADPYARPNPALVDAVDAVLLRVAAALLRNEPELLQGLGSVAEASGAQEGALAQVGPCLAYLRDRIGVPRDMRLPAAKLLRAYLGEAIARLPKS